MGWTPSPVEKNGFKGSTSKIGAYSVDTSNGESIGMMTHAGCAEMGSNIDGDGGET